MFVLILSVATSSGNPTFLESDTDENLKTTGWVLAAVVIFSPHKSSIKIRPNACTHVTDSSAKVEMSLDFGTKEQK